MPSISFCNSIDNTSVDYISLVICPSFVIYCSHTEGLNYSVITKSLIYNVLVFIVMYNFEFAASVI